MYNLGLCIDDTHYHATLLGHLPTVCAGGGGVGTGLPRHLCEVGTCATQVPLLDRYMC